MQSLERLVFLAFLFFFFTSNKSRYKNGRSFIYATIFCYALISWFSNWSTHLISWIRMFWLKEKSHHHCVDLRYPSGSNNEVILVRTYLFIVAVILLSNFLVSIINWSVTLSNCSPKTFIVVSFMRSCSVIFHIVQVSWNSSPVGSLIYQRFTCSKYEHSEFDVILCRKLQFLVDFFSDICPLTANVHKNSRNF